jgi:hypothetical protein
MRVAGLENPRTQPLDFNNDSVLPLDRIGEIIRRILREEFWCRLEGSKGFVHFGWDYYMYIGVPIAAPQRKQGHPNSAYMLRNLHLLTSKMRLSLDLSRNRKGRSSTSLKGA